MATNTLAGMTVEQLRDLAKRAEAAAKAQEAEQKREAAEAEKQKPVFSYGRYSLDRDGVIRYGGLTSVFNKKTMQELVSGMKDASFPASSDFVRVAEFIVAFGKHLEKERYSALASNVNSGMSGINSQFYNANYFGPTFKY